MEPINDTPDNDKAEDASITGQDYVPSALENAQRLLQEDGQRRIALFHAGLNKLAEELRVDLTTQFVITAR